MVADKKQTPSMYNLFVAEMMPILCATESRKSKEIRKRPSELMKTNGELWQSMKRTKTSLVYNKKTGVYEKQENEDLYFSCDEGYSRMHPSGIPEKECN
jgi:hypothetical protein